jgi:hypothetical protein
VTIIYWSPISECGKGPKNWTEGIYKNYEGKEF